MLLFLLTAVVLAAWFLFVSRLGEGDLATRLVLAGTGASGQITLTSMILGVTGALTVTVTGATNLAIAGGLAAVALLVPQGSALPSRNVDSRIGKPRGREEPSRAAPAGAAGARLSGGKPSSAPQAAASSHVAQGDLALEATRWRLASDLRSMARAARRALAWESALLGLIVLFVGIWLATAIVFYPPRGVDDLVYHLPPIYQAVEDHRFQILPLALRKFFAFPFSAEMPFLWAALLTGSVQWVGASQALFGLLAMLAVFALGRRYGLSPRGAVLAAGLFAVIPVVLLQATSNYIDLIVNTWVLAAATALLRYEEAGCRIALALGGFSSGLVLGSKYQTIPFALALAGIAGLLVWRIEISPKGRAAAAALFGVPALAAGAYWYVRNWILFSNPFYPLPVSLLGVSLFSGDWPQGPSIWSKLASDPAEALRIPLKDPGLGTFNGGFGFFFWGFAVPALALLAARIYSTGSRERPGRLLVLGLVPLGFAALFLSPYDDLALTFRYVLGVVPLGLIAIAFLIEEAAARRLGAATLIRGVAVLSALATLLTAAASSKPLLNLAPVAADPPQVRSLSSLRYLANTLRGLSEMSRCWAPLDEMTRGGAGLSVYQAADFKVFWTAPTYGTQLQNRIWNFEGRLDSEPDAYFFHSPRRDTLYIGKEIHREVVAADARYRLVASEGDDATTLYVARAVLAQKGREARLADYYRKTEPELLSRTAPSAARMEPESVLLAPFPMASAYLVHRADGRLRGDLEPVTTKDAEAVAERYPDRILYSFGKALTGRSHAVVEEITVRGQRISLVRNGPLGSGVGSKGRPTVGQDHEREKAGSISSGLATPELPG